VSSYGGVLASKHGWTIAQLTEAKRGETCAYS
jgi:hypothetical protein